MQTFLHQSRIIFVGSSVFLAALAMSERVIDDGAGVFVMPSALVASDGKPRDEFGSSVSVSGDTLLVGAMQDGDKGERAGSAYVFRNVDMAAVGFVHEDCKLLAGDAMAGDLMGGSVSLSGAGGLVGASGDDDNGEGSGSAYFFTKLDSARGDVTESVKLLASDGAEENRFGEAVALSGNVGLVGALGKDRYQGSAYLFRNLDKAKGIVREDAQLVPSDGKRGDWYGIAVAISGNIGLVSAHSRMGKDSPVYLFLDLDKATGRVTESAKMLAPKNIAFSGFFGSAMALSGSTAILGALSSSEQGYGSGSAYLYRDLDRVGEAANWSARLLASDGKQQDWFGSSVACSKKVALVGAPEADATQKMDTGAAYLFLDVDKAEGDVMESLKITAPGREPSIAFCSSVALEGDDFFIASKLIAGKAQYTGRVDRGSVSSMTTLDTGSSVRSISGMSFVSREDWVIGAKTDENRVMLAAGCRAEVKEAGKEVCIGREKGSDNNVLDVAGVLEAGIIKVGAETGTSGNELSLRATAVITSTKVIMLGSGSLISLEGDLSEKGALFGHLRSTELNVWDGERMQRVTAQSLQGLLKTEFNGTKTVFSVMN